MYANQTKTRKKPETLGIAVCQFFSNQNISGDILAIWNFSHIYLEALESLKFLAHSVNESLELISISNVQPNGANSICMYHNIQFIL